jgi:hypothetical protein
MCDWSIWNGDGDLDLVVAGFESNNVVWYENRLRQRIWAADKRR